MTINKLLLLGLIIMTWACASHVANKSSGDTRTDDLIFIDDQTYLLTQKSIDESYGYSEGNPVKVGGISEDGVVNEVR